MDQNLLHLSERSYEDEIFIKNICTWAKCADDDYYCKYSMFLSDRKAAAADASLRAMGFENYAFYGGYEGASRKVLSVFGKGARPEERDFPIASVSFRYKPCYELSHRDFLGVLMSLEIKRECIGDIVIGKGVCVVFAAPQVIKDILSLGKVGRIGVKASSGSDALCEIDLSERVTEICGTVSSMRLDCIVAFCANVSRKRAQEIIAVKQVAVGGIVRENESLRLDAGDVFTIRGYGKFVISELGGKTRKDRIHIRIKKYV